MKNKKKIGNIIDWAFVVVFLLFIGFNVFAITSNTPSIAIPYTEFILSYYNTNVSLFLSDTKNLTATIVNQTWLDFDGNNDYVNLTNNSIFETKNSSFTIMAFVYADNLTTSTRRDIVTKSKVGHREYTLATRETNKTNFIIWNSSGHTYNIATGDTVEEGKWFQIAGKVEDVTHDTRVYTNGGLKGSDTSGGENRLTSANSEVLIGDVVSPSTGELDWDGRIDDVRFYNKSLDDKQIRRIYNESDYGSGLGKSIPVLNYHQIGTDSGSVTTVVNQSNFEEQMSWLNSSRYTTITYKDWLEWRNGSRVLPEKPIILVFDDGWLSVFTNATPIMDNYSFIGVAGIISEFPISNPNKNYMNWTQIQNLSNRGWQIASHSTNESSVLNVTTASRTQYFNLSKSAIDGNLSINVNVWIYPNNDNNDTTDTECATFYTICSGYSTSTNTQEAFLFKRANLTHEEGAPIGLRRIVIANTTLLTDFIDAIDYHDSLVGYYKFNENNGSRVYDASGLGGVNGTISSATWNTDQVNITLNNTIDYSIDTFNGTFRLLNPLYAWNRIFLVYNSTADLINNTKNTTQNFAISGLTNALVYLDNRTLIGNANISENDGNITLNVPAGNISYVLDNFNLTEGVSRRNNPLSYSFISSTSKHISSNLTTTINATVAFNVNHCNINSITYTSDSGNSSYTPLYSCSSDVVTIPYLRGIERSANSNIITISYNNPQTGSGGSGSGVTFVNTCNPLWICDGWSSCSQGLRSRSCFDINYCSSQENPPLLLSCSKPLPSDRIEGCVDFSSLDGVITLWKVDVYRLDILNEAIYKWKNNINC